MRRRLHVLLALLLGSAAGGRKRGRPTVRTRTGRKVDYEVVRSKGRSPLDRHNAGGERVAPVVRSSTWMEVSHTRDDRDPLDGSNLWMYRARDGKTGLFFRSGDFLECSDTVDLARYMNATYYDPRDYGSKMRLFRDATEGLGLPANVRSIVFTSHLDACCDRRLYEVISLEPPRAGCPSSPDFRSGPRYASATSRPIENATVDESKLRPCACLDASNVC